MSVLVSSELSKFAYCCSNKVEQYSFTNLYVFDGPVYYENGDRAKAELLTNNYIQQAIKENKYEFFLFSDGSDEELEELLQLPKVSRLFTGSALGDILALSKCNAIIGSDSTFSGWGAFLGQVPVVFPKQHFGRVLKNNEQELVLVNLKELGKLNSWVKQWEKVI